MKINFFPFVAALAILIIVLAYLAKFFPIFGTQLSEDTAVWGQFGDYIGGTLNPILSFLSVVLLIKSVSLQTEANNDLKKELKDNEKTENFRAFNVIFFSMIESQRNIFREFKIEFGEDQLSEKFGNAAVIYIEDKIHELRQAEGNDKKIADFLNELDAEDRIFGVLRAFYITVKTICEKLHSDRGFEVTAAKEQIFTLVNFTEFSQLRLVVIGIQFLDYKSCNYLKNNDLFLSALAEVNLSIDLY